MSKALEAAENRMGRITSTLDWRDVEAAWADVDAYIDALFDFDHISGDDRDRLQQESRSLRDATFAKLKKRAGAKRY